MSDKNFCTRISTGNDRVLPLVSWGGGGSTYFSYRTSVEPPCNLSSKFQRNTVALQGVKVVLHWSICNANLQLYDVERKIVFAIFAGLQRVARF